MGIAFIVGIFPLIMMTIAIQDGVGNPDRTPRITENVTNTNWRKIVNINSCGQCHIQEQKTLELTRHWMTWDDRYKSPKAKRILKNLDLTMGMRFNNVCYNCHFTAAETTYHEIKPMAGISCQTCHGAAEDWIHVHHNLGLDNETNESKIDRMLKSEKAGMVRPANLYKMISKCLTCHTTPNEELVNTGGHTAGSDFNMVAWTQGEVRHNFINTPGHKNRKSAQPRLRMMYVMSAMVDLEKSMLALGKARDAGRYRDAMTKRILKAYNDLKLIDSKVDIQEVKNIIDVVPLRDNALVIGFNDLAGAAKVIAREAKAFEKRSSGTELAPLDPLINKLEVVGDPND